MNYSYFVGSRSKRLSCILWRKLCARCSILQPLGLRYKHLPSRAKLAGFSLIEMLVVIGLISILSIVTFANLSTRSTSATLDSTTRQIVATMREAESRSAAQDNATEWGVHFGNTTNTAAFYALFKTSYSSANTVNYYRLPSGVSYSTSSIAGGGSLDITFAQISGIPSATASITLNLTRGVATSATIIVNSTGLISF